ncbi:MAG: hypothetical protein Q8P56_00275 [Candidatus Uhrbacteria bacterium]|nr:hypothetical protein [Candidatus Uhrbacteria bacterium]MDZ4227001.1 hypothetical protein [Patescibacteria group bacterium]
MDIITNIVQVLFGLSLGLLELFIGFFISVFTLLLHFVQSLVGIVS